MNYSRIEDERLGRMEDEDGSCLKDVQYCWDVCLAQCLCLSLPCPMPQSCQE